MDASQKLKKVLYQHLVILKYMKAKSQMKLCFHTVGHSEETDNDVLNNKVEVVFSSPELVIARPKWRDWVK